MSKEKKDRWHYTTTFLEERLADSSREAVKHLWSAPDTCPYIAHLRAAIMQDYYAKHDLVKWRRTCEVLSNLAQLARRDKVFAEAIEASECDTDCERHDEEDLHVYDCERVFWRIFKREFERDIALSGEWHALIKRGGAPPMNGVLLVCIPYNAQEMWEAFEAQARAVHGFEALRVAKYEEPFLRSMIDCD